MTVESLINRFIQYASWLYYRQWQKWELVAVVVTIVVLLLLLGAWRRSALSVRRLHERSPIIGLRLAGHRRH
jgi:uncharacterized membrane protein YhaH (DUF805 family)